MADPAVLQGYAANAAELIPAYEMLDSLDVLAPVAVLLPVRPSRVLDIGAGTGRDAAFLARRGHDVVAVEPVGAFREAGAALHPDERIRWLDDRLPALAHVLAEAVRYDLVLLIGVWQHLPAGVHKQAISSLSATLAPEGRLIISVRHGPGPPTRPCFPADPDRIVDYAQNADMRLRMRSAAGSLQQGNRQMGVTWSWLCFEHL